MMHDRRERIIAKALLLLFEKDEDELINIIMSLLVNSDAQIIQQDICTDLSFPGMNIDLSKRIVYRDGKEIKMELAVGDKVLMSQYAGTNVKLDGVEYTILRQSDVLAKIEG